jgi:uncharacterized membrane protein
MKYKRYLAGLIPLLIILVSFCLAGVALAQDEQTQDAVSLTTDYPSLEGQATDSFTYNIVISYTSATDRVFDLNPTGPTGWTVYVTPQYDSTRISSISAEAAPFSSTKNVKLMATPPAYPYESPGSYTLNLQVSSGNLTGAISVTAKVLPKAVLSVAPANQSGTYNTRATAGRDNFYSIRVSDTGTSTVENVTFNTTNKPDGWDVSFSPEKIDSIDVADTKTIDVNIKPPPNTASGDYMLTLQVTGDSVSSPASMDVRVTVETSTIWGWVGVAIIIIVIIGLFSIFMRFGRR